MPLDAWDGQNDGGYAEVFAVGDPCVYSEYTSEPCGTPREPRFPAPDILNGSRFPKLQSRIATHRSARGRARGFHHELVERRYN